MSLIILFSILFTCIEENLQTIYLIKTKLINDSTLPFPFYKNKERYSLHEVIIIECVTPTPHTPAFVVYYYYCY